MSDDASLTCESKSNKREEVQSLKVYSDNSNTHLTFQ